MSKNASSGAFEKVNRVATGELSQVTFPKRHIYSGIMNTLNLAKTRMRRYLKKWNYLGERCIMSKRFTATSNLVYTRERMRGRKRYRKRANE